MLQAEVSDNWMPAARVASRALGLLLAAGAVLTVVGVVGQLLVGGRPPVLGTVLSAFAMVLAWLGAVEGGMVVATGVVYLGICYHRAATRVALPASDGREQLVRHLVLGVKAGLVGSGLAFVLALVVFAIDRDLRSGIAAPMSGSYLQVLRLLVPGVGFHVMVAAVAIAARAGVRLDGTLTVPDGWLRVGVAAVRGAGRVLVVGVGGALLVRVVLQLYWSVGGPSGGGARLLSPLLTTLNQVAAAWVDIAAQTAVHALRFVQGAPMGWMVSPVWGSAWIWLTVPALAGGYVAAGVDIARRADGREDAVRSSLLVGPVVGALLAVAMIGRVGMGGAAPLLVAALVLGSLWGGLTLGSALAQRSRYTRRGAATPGTRRDGSQDDPPVTGWVPTPALGFTEAVGRVLRGSLDFRGRARRSEYWWWMLATMPFSLLVILSSSQILVVILVLLFVLPHTAVSVRRLHDLGRSGVWVVLLFAVLLGPTLLGLSSSAFGAGLAVLVIGELVGGVAALVFAVAMELPGRPEANAYGPSPAHRWYGPQETS